MGKSGARQTGKKRAFTGLYRKERPDSPVLSCAPFNGQPLRLHGPDTGKR